jgi:hypothetical protein
VPSSSTVAVTSTLSEASSALATVQGIGVP